MKNLYNIKNELYIISNNEDINENSYIITQDSRLVKVSYLLSKDIQQGGNKVILTTNKLLIKDGVQPIEDYFLEWLVKNPSCESVEVIKELVQIDQSNPVTKGCTALVQMYKIIIPREEYGFQDSIENSLNIMSIASSMFGKPEEPKQEYQSDCICENICRGFINVKCKQLKKQETVEEAAENHHNTFTKDLSYAETRRESFIEGAKWKAERCYTELLEWLASKDYLSDNVDHIKKEFEEYKGKNHE